MTWQPGLTLVELLLVLALVAVLLALLAPAGASAIEQVNMVQCCNHLRALGLATSLYAAANDGRLPVSTVVDGPHPALVAALAGRVEDPRIYFCPGESAAERQFSEENLAAGRIGYFYYSCERASDNRLVSTFLRWNVTWPRRLNGAMDAQTWVASDAWFSGEQTTHRLAKKAVNYLTLRGDVQTVTESPRQAFH